MRYAVRTDFLRNFGQTTNFQLPADHRIEQHAAIRLPQPNNLRRPRRRLRELVEEEIAESAENRLSLVDLHVTRNVAVGCENRIGSGIDERSVQRCFALRR